MYPLRLDIGGCRLYAACIGYEIAPIGEGPMYRVQRNWGARLREYTYKGMQVVFLENETLRFGILADKGTDVFELNYKPRDMDFVWLTAGGVRDPRAYLSTSPDPLSTFNDYYLGGWQEIFPDGGLPALYEGVQFGQHGEISNLPWDYDIIADTEAEVAVRFSVRTQKTPFYLEKEVRLRAGERALTFSERLVNESDVPLHAMWGHHLTFGPPFLDAGCRLRFPDGTTVVPDEGLVHPTDRRVQPGKSVWPAATGMDGAPVDLSRLPPRGTPSDVCYLTDVPEGWYEVANPATNLVFRLEWDVATMPHVWFWQEFGATKESPWWGRHYNIGLEPFTSHPGHGLPAAIGNGTARLIGPREELRFALRAVIREENTADGASISDA